MLRRRARKDETPVTGENLPLWPSNSGLRKQHSVEYWMMASLLYEGGGGNETREAVRVWDPETAGAFFVPFFSSLNFNTHGHNMTDPDTEFDRQLQNRHRLKEMYTDSYGILLLEMFTGRRPTSEASFRDGFSLHDYVQMSFPERVMEVMDPHFIQQLVADGRDHILESIISVLRIGVMCSSQSPRDRMEMGDAVNQLHSIRNLLLR